METITIRDQDEGYIEIPLFRTDSQGEKEIADENGNYRRCTWTLGKECPSELSWVIPFVCEAYDRDVNPLPILRQMFKASTLRLSKGVSWRDEPILGVEITPEFVDRVSSGAWILHGVIKY